MLENWMIFKIRLGLGLDKKAGGWLYRDVFNPKRYSRSRPSTCL